MWRKMLPTIVFPLMAFAAVFAWSFGEFRFHSRGVVPLDPTVLESADGLSFDRYYELKSPMRYKVEIANQQDAKATLLWPGGTLARVLILVPRQSADLDAQERFRGRLIRCLYRCVAGDKVIEMGDFSGLIAKKFPDEVRGAKDLPQFILDTAQEPLGLKRYFGLYRQAYGGAALVAFFALALLARAKRPGIRRP